MGNKFKTLKESFVSKRRLKIWQTRPYFHCALLGTCLTLNELRSSIKKSGVTIPFDITDYELHSTAVNHAEDKNPLSNALQKLLDKKYARWIKKVKTLKLDEDFSNYWKQSLNIGDISGPFWALSTHPSICPDLQKDIYGDVHMLSHLQGASNRVDRQQLKQLNEETENLKQEKQKKIVSHQKKQNYHNLELDQLQKKNKQLLKQLQSYSNIINPIYSKNSNKTQDKLNQQLDYTQKKLAERNMQLDNLEHQVSAFKELLAESEESRAALSTALNNSYLESSPSTPDSINLKGKKVLYIGGRISMTPHMKSLVESHNGKFIYHDGGKEDNRANLQCELATADMVFCPINCISHDACLRAKKHCQKNEKPFIPLRSSGLSTFATHLQKPIN